MTTAAEHGQTLLAAIIPDRMDLLDRALRQLGPAHFTDAVQRNLYSLLERHAEITGAVITRERVADLLHSIGADAGKIALYQETFDLLAARHADEADFRWSLEQLRELAASRSTGEALTQAMEILTKGAQDESGQTLRGHSEARTHVLQAFAAIDRDLSMQDAPEGDMGCEGDQILSDYAARKAARTAGRSVGIDFGIPDLDERLGGIQNGDLCLVVGYTSEGKTSLAAVQLAWHASVRQGRNVVVLTTETPREQVRRRIIARHSCLEHFGIPDGLNSRDIRHGTLTAEQERQLAAVVADSDSNPGYGKRYICQVPRGATIGYLESKLTRLQRMFPIDLVVVDSLYLLQPDRRRQSVREELSGMLMAAKQLATTFNDGCGIPLVSPWQVSRSARDEAERTGSYNTRALSETAEASNSADIIVSLLAPLDNDNRHAVLRMQVMKNRDGERANSLEVSIDYATSRFIPKDQAAAANTDSFWSGDLIVGFDGLT